MSRVLVGGLVVASMVHTAVLLPRYLSISRAVPPEFQTVAWAILVTVVTAVGACALALVLALRSWSRPGARSLALFLAFLSLVWGSLLRFLEVEVTSDEMSINLSAGGFPLMLAVAGLFLGTAAFVRFSSLFPVALTEEALPTPRGPTLFRRLRVMAFDPRVVWGVAFGLILLHRAMDPVMGILIPTGAGEEPDPAAVSSAILPLLLVNLLFLGIPPLLGVGLGIRNLSSSYKLAPREDRRRVLWLVSGTSAAGWLLLGGISALVLIPLLDLDVPPWLVPILAGMIVAAPAVLVATTALALFYAGAVDPGLVLKRSTVAGALGVVGILLFAGMEEALSNWVESRAGLPGMVGSVLAGAIAAGVMLPFRKGVGRLASRLLPGQESTPAGSGSR
jgi:hypothetical protein